MHLIKIFNIWFLIAVAIFLTSVLSKQIRPRLISDELEEINKEQDELIGDSIKGAILRRSVYVDKSVQDRPYGLPGPRRQTASPPGPPGHKTSNYIQYPIQGPICPPGPV